MINEYNRDDNMFGFLMDWDSKQQFIEDRVNGARRRGLRLGKEQGIKLGEKRGIKLGEEKNKLQTARNMLAKNFSMQDIADVTGLKESYLKTIKL